MDLDELLSAMDRTAANIAKLDDVWSRAASFIPNGPAAGSAPEYDDLCRAWNDLLAGLPPIDSWTMTSQFPDIDALGRAFIDYADIGEHPDHDHDAGAAAAAEHGLRHLPGCTAPELWRDAIHTQVEGSAKRHVNGLGENVTGCLQRTFKLKQQVGLYAAVGTCGGKQRSLVIARSDGTAVTLIQEPASFAFAEALHGKLVWAGPREETSSR